MSVRSLALALSGCALVACAPRSAPLLAPAPLEMEAPDEAERMPAIAEEESIASPPADAGVESAVALDAVEEEPAEPTWDIDVRSYETHDRVEFYLKRFTGPARATFGRWLERGTRYEPMIREKLRAAGLPEDLTYLALVESGYEAHAYSSAAAVGLWQIMAPTARGLGLRVDWWVDERRDPVRATDGAVRFLSYLNDQFGSMYLAAAAYNGGPTRVSRGLSRYADDLEGTTGDDVFFALEEKDFLPRETRDYVPKLIAAAIVAKEPEKYGIEVTPQPVLAYDTVRVGPATPLAAIATATGAPLTEIVELNPGVLRGMTSPKGSLLIKVPVGTAAAFDSAYAALDSADRRAYRRVRTTKNEQLATIARRHGLSAKQLSWYNPTLEKSRKTGAVYAGQTVLVPTAAVVRAAHDIPDPSLDQRSAGRRVHVVKSGETLSGIAQKYDTTVKSIMSLNGLRKSTIFPGQELFVPGAPAKRTGKRTGR